MQQRRLKDQGDEEEEEKEKKSKKKGSDLKIHDLEDELEMSSDESDLSDADGETSEGDSVSGPLSPPPLSGFSSPVLCSLSTPLH